MERPAGRVLPGPVPGLDGGQATGVPNGRRLRREIAERGFTYVAVRGSSMLPTLRPGDVVRLDACADPRPGQIIAFERMGNVIVHRIVRRGRCSFVCRGDNRVAGDGVFPLEAVVGRATVAFGPGRMAGEVIRDSGVAHLIASARIRSRRLRNAVAHLDAEVTLLVTQALGRQAFGADHPCGLAGLDVPTGGDAPQAAALLTASVLGTLPRAARIGLLREHLAALPPGGVLVVHGVMARRRLRLALAGAAMRRGLRRLGVAAGETGDTTWPSVDGTRHVPLHVHTVTGLDAEVRVAGGRIRSVEAAREGLVPVWRARVTPAATP